jgi:predicted nucleic acid-binding protein
MSQKFRLPPDRLRILETYVNACTNRVELTLRLDVVKDDPDDNRVLECAAAAGSDYIISGDGDDLLRLKQYGRVRVPILRVSEFLDLNVEP